MNLNRVTIPECEALFRDGSVDAVRTNGNLDITIGDTAYEDVEVHYHCLPIWESQSHPHNALMMAGAFEVGDAVLVLCNEDGTPIYVTGFKENPKICEPIIVMRKLVGGSWDYWYWVVSLGQGYHANPGKGVPTTPEIINKWWSCSGLDEVVEYYTRTTPTLEAVDTQACGDDCGLVNFDSGVCCDSPENEDDDSDEVYLCPCGGDGAGPNGYGVVCSEEVQCSGGCAEESNTIYYPGAKSTGSYTNRQSTNCDQGYSWGVSVGGLSEQIDIGPRTNITGSESSDTVSLEDSQCTPIQTVKHTCDLIDPVTCICDTWYNPAFSGYECRSGPYCTSWIQTNGGGYRWRLADYGQGTQYQGCIDYTRVVQTGTYSTGDASVDTVIDSGVKSTIFEGLWSSRTFNGNGQEGTYQHGWTTPCITCSDSGSLGGSESRSSFAFTEISYGIAGWFTIVYDDGRLAVLIPKLSLSASTSTVAGSTTGSITSITTALLRIVDDADYDFEIAEGDSNYILSTSPGDRDGLGIRPTCYNPRDIPLEITLRGFCWHGRYDWVFAAFEFDGDFQAELVRDVDGSWQEEDMTDFKTFVEINGLEEHTMYLA